MWIPSGKGEAKKHLELGKSNIFNCRGDKEDRTTKSDRVELTVLTVEDIGLRI